MISWFTAEKQDEESVHGLKGTFDYIDYKDF